MQSLPCSFSIPFHSLSFDLARNLMGNAPCGQSPCPLPQTYTRHTLSTLQGFYFSSFFCIFNAFCFASLSPFVCCSHVSLHKGAAAITCLAKCVRVSEVCVRVCVYAIMIGKFRFAVAFKNLVHAADTTRHPAPRQP